MHSRKKRNIFPKHGLCIHRQLVAATHGPLPSKVWGSQLHAQLVAPCFLIPFTCHLKFPCPTQRYEHDQPKQVQPPPADQICLDSISPCDLLYADSEPTSQGRTQLKSRGISWFCGTKQVLRSALNASSS